MGTIKIPDPGTPVFENPMIRAAIAPQTYCQGSKCTAEYARFCVTLQQDPNASQ